MLPDIQQPHNDARNGEECRYDPENARVEVDAGNSKESDRGAHQHSRDKICVRPVSYVLPDKNRPSLDNGIGPSRPFDEKFVDALQIRIGCAKAEECHNKVEDEVRRVMTVIGDPVAPHLQGLFQIVSSISPSIMLRQSFAG